MRRIALGMGLMMVAACGGTGGGTGGDAADGSTGASSAAAATSPSAEKTAGATFVSYDAGAIPGGPGASKRYGMGHGTPAAEIAKWNDDVGPDGAELPAGKGSVAEGEALFNTQCAACHGMHGEGIAPLYPALIGRDEKGEGFHFADDPSLVRTIGNYWPNATTIFDYVRRAMPLTAPGSLTDNQVYAVTAYLLSANKVIGPDVVLDAKALRAVKMPYADRFVPDDRRGGHEVK